MRRSWLSLKLMNYLHQLPLGSWNIRQPLWSSWQRRAPFSSDSHCGSNCGSESSPNFNPLGGRFDVFRWFWFFAWWWPYGYPHKLLKGDMCLWQSKRYIPYLIFIELLGIQTDWYTTQFFTTSLWIVSGTPNEWPCRNNSPNVSGSSHFSVTIGEHSKAYA